MSIDQTLTDDLYEYIRTSGSGRTFAALLLRVLDRAWNTGQPLDLNAADLELSDALEALGRAGRIKMDISPAFAERRAWAVLSDLDDVLDHAAWTWGQARREQAEAKRTAQAAVEQAADAGMPETQIAARLRIDRMTVRAWTGKEPAAYAKATP